jgi:hypothetical protein
MDILKGKMEALRSTQQLTWRIEFLQVSDSKRNGMSCNGCAPQLE